MCMIQIMDKLIEKINDLKTNTFTKNEILDIIKNFNDENIIESNGIIINITKHLVIIDGNEIHLPKKVFNLLCYFISHKNQILTRTQILKDIWGYDFKIQGRTVDIHIRKLRSFLPKNYIQTTNGCGYTWVEL